MSREKFYDNLKSDWRELRLKYAVDLSSSRIESNSNDFAYVGLENIESGTGRLIPKTENQTNGDGETESSSVVNVFEKGDVLFSKLRPYLAKGFIAKESGTSTTELLVFKPKESTDNKFLLYTLLSPNFVKFVDSATFGSRMPRADWNFVRDIFVPIPPLDEQRAIAAMLDRETARLDELITEKERLFELLSLDDKPALEPAEVQAALWGKEAGNTIKAKLLRGGEIKEVEIVLGERPARNGGEHRGWRGGRGWHGRGGGCR